MFFLFIPLYLILIANPLRSILAPNTCRTKGQVAMVFTDGPVIGTREIIDNLGEKDIKATFMFSIVNITEPDIAEIINHAVDEGHTVGLRVNTVYDFQEMEEKEIEEAIRSEVEVLSDIAGQDVKYIMVNQEDKTNENVIKATEKLDLIIVDYNYDVYGSCYDADDMVDKWKLKLRSIKPNAISYIILQHDEREENLQILDDIVDNASKSGFSFVTIEDCLGDDVEGVTPSGSAKSPRRKSGAPPLFFAGCCLLTLLAL